MAPNIWKVLQPTGCSAVQWVVGFLLRIVDLNLSLHQFISRLCGPISCHWSISIGYNSESLLKPEVCCYCRMIKLLNDKTLKEAFVSSYL